MRDEVTGENITEQQLRALRDDCVRYSIDITDEEGTLVSTSQIADACALALAGDQTARERCADLYAAWVRETSRDDGTYLGNGVFAENH